MKSLIGRLAALTAMLALAAPSLAQAPANLGPAPSVTASHAPRGGALSQPPAPTPSGAPAAHPLTADDVSAYLDGFMPYALARGNIAGAVVVVVKDGQPLFEKGYGVSDVKTLAPVDPQTTLFRPGSVSKLFTWTAVMQLVAEGKIDLDRDINAYLDFKIPPAFGKPITMRDLMTHTPGFSDAAKDLLTTDPKKVKSLEASLKSAIPARIFPPGTTAAYSNYGAALAGYIVQRLSGEPFADYIQNHIFTPLGMTHSTFIAPLPTGWARNMSKGYLVATGPAQPFEFVAASPAGALTATGADMGTFMIAQLQNGQYQGRQILDAATAQLMHSPQFQPVPPLPAMDLGFYQEPGNGHRVIGHAGDTTAFHSDLHLYLDDHVGLYISMNSLGSAGAAEYVRGALFRGFTDRYFPAPAEHLATWPSAVRDGRTLAGYYIWNRRSDSGWLRLASYLLGQAKIATDKDGVVTVSTFRGANGAPKHWREVGPFVYQEVGGESRTAALVRGGKVVSVATDDFPPVMALQPTTASMSAAWNLPLFIATLAILALTVVLWPLVAVVRWRYKQRFALTGRAAWLYRAVRVVALIDLIFLLSWFALVAAAEVDLAFLSSGVDWLLRLMQFVGLVGVIGALAAVANVVVVVGDKSRSWWAKLSSALIAIACLATVWFAFGEHLITLGLAY
ncbi:MAG: beta-lactamase family protein [Pseudomonadota bacterium]|nr:beta-lactamase family protein [Pseudomonadota bacterium]